MVWSGTPGIRSGQAEDFESMSMTITSLGTGSPRSTREPAGSAGVEGWESVRRWSRTSCPRQNKASQAGSDRVSQKPIWHDTVRHDTVRPRATGVVHQLNQVSTSGKPMTSTTTKEPLENLATLEPDERDKDDPKQVPVNRWLLCAVSVGLIAACFSQDAGRLVRGTNLTLVINPTEVDGSGPSPLATGISVRTSR